jgi:DNA-binding transcriptional LysR family regulator
MDPMDLTLVRYFNAVARHGSFSAAARAVGISQPGLTKAVRRLEQSLECRLFRRLPRGVAMTPQGEALLRHVGFLDVQLQDAQAELHALGRGAVGELRIGAGPSWLSRALPGIVADIASRNPGLRFRVLGGFNISLMDALRTGELDLVVSALPDRTPPGLRAIPLTTDTISVVARIGHPLRARRLPAVSSTLDYPWVLPGRDVLSRLRLEALFRVAGHEPPCARIESDSISFIASVLRESDMLSFATSQILHNEMVGIAPLPIPRLSMTRSAGILLRASTGITPAARTFVDAAQQVARRLGRN